VGETAKGRRVYPIAEAATIAGVGLRWIRLRKLRRDRFRLRKAFLLRSRNYGEQDGATRLQPGM